MVTQAGRYDVGHNEHDQVLMRDCEVDSPSASVLIENMRPVYIVGAQCTGKSTLSRAVEVKIKEEYPQLTVELVNEIARPALDEFHINRNDIRNDPERCYFLQKLILEAQCRRESEIDANTMMVSDRSGIDPLAYTSLHLNDRNVQDLAQSESWKMLCRRMRDATVILCEPVEDWLHDDGVRLMPVDVCEWNTLHRTFGQLLKQHRISYHVLPTTVVDLSARVASVMKLWESGSGEGPRGSDISRR